MSSEQHPRFSQPGAAPEQPAPAWCDPADANTEWEWIQSMAKIGFTLVLVEMCFDRAQLEEFGHPQVLAAQLIKEELGHFDSIKQGNPFGLFFYVGPMPAAVEFIKLRLQELGLLPLCKIGLADSAEKVWRTFYPAMPGPGEQS